MAIKNILNMGNPMLRDKAREVDSKHINSLEMQNIVKDMVDTLEQAGGIGLAAPQIGIPFRIVVIKIPKEESDHHIAAEVPLSIFINPVLTILGDEEAAHWEGCLSVPGMRGLVSRPQHLKLQYSTLEEELNELEVKGFLATVLQHECDHLDGILYIDRLVDTKHLSFESEFLEFVAN